MKRKGLLIALAVAALCCAVGWTVRAQRQSKVQWEYEIHYLQYEARPAIPTGYEKRLNELGAQGWELVHTPPDGERGPFIFKREK